MKSPLLNRAQRRILALVAEGLRNHEIAAELNYATSTVEVNMTRIYAKLGIQGPSCVDKRHLATWMYLTGEAFTTQRQRAK